MTRDLPPLGPEERKRIAGVLSYWGRSHPKRETPIIQLANGSELTPLDIALAVEEGDALRGQLLFRVFAAGLLDDGVEPPESLDEILADFERDAAEWEMRFR